MRLETYEHRGWEYRAILRDERYAAEFREVGAQKWQRRCKGFTTRHEALEEALKIVGKRARAVLGKVKP